MVGLPFEGVDRCKPFYSYLHGRDMGCGRQKKSCRYVVPFGHRTIHEIVRQTDKQITEQ